jgi:hypothetical protein
LSNGEYLSQIVRLELEFGESYFFICEKDTLMQSGREEAEGKHQVRRETNVAACFWVVSGCVNHADFLHLWAVKVGDDFTLVYDKKGGASLQSFD